MELYPPYDYETVGVSPPLLFERKFKTPVRYKYEPTPLLNRWGYVATTDESLLNYIKEISVSGVDFKEANIIDINSYLCHVEWEGVKFQIIISETGKESRSYSIHQVISNKDPEPFLLFLACKFFKEKGEEPNSVKILNLTGEGELVGKAETFADFDCDVDLNYPEEFKKADENINDFINKPATKGRLVFLHGKSGCGKTHYLRHLVSRSKGEVEFVYIPPHLIESLGSPKAMDFLKNLKGSIIIIEDAEAILRGDDEGRNQIVSNILQITDGFLGDILDLKIIATFNFDYKKVDPALRRKGRLYLEYAFEKLSVKESQKKVDSLELDYKVTEPMTLGEIYNIEFENELSQEEERKVGF